MVTKIGLDLGYANITLSDAMSEIYREPSIALMYKDARADGVRIISVGNEAFEYSADENGNEEGMLVRPFKNGILYDHQLTGEIIKHAISAVGAGEKIRCVLGVPSDFLPKQEKTLYEMLNKAGVSEVYSVNRAYAALIGAGYSPNINAISINVGAQACEILVVHSGKVIIADRKNVGGEDFDKAVKKYVLDQGDVNISLYVARAIKERLGAVWKGKPNDSIDIEGTLSLTGSKLKMNVTTEDIVGVFEEPLYDIMRYVVDVTNRIPPELIPDIFANGIILTGGGAELYGMENLMEKVLGITVTKPNNAIDAVAKGLSRICAFLPAKMKYESKNITDSLFKYYQDRQNKD